MNEFRNSVAILSFRCGAVKASSLKIELATASLCASNEQSRRMVCRTGFSSGEQDSLAAAIGELAKLMQQSVPAGIPLRLVRL